MSETDETQPTTEKEGWVPICCERCGLLIRGIGWHLNNMILCGQCLDDYMNDDNQVLDTIELSGGL